jgi:hypothetical protein
VEELAHCLAGDALDRLGWLLLKHEHADRLVKLYDVVLDLLGEEVSLADSGPSTEGVNFT